MRQKLFIFGLWIGLAAAGSSGLLAGEALGLRSAIERALARNFDLAVAREAGDAGRDRSLAAEAAYVPVVSVSFNHTDTDSPAAEGATPKGETEARENAFTTAVGGILPTGATYSLSVSVSETNGTRGAGTSRTDFDSASATLGAFTFTQPLWRDREIDATRLNIRQRRADARISVLDLTLQAIETVTAVERAYHALAAAREIVNVRTAALALAEQSLGDAEARRAVGTQTRLDEQQARAEVATNHADLLAARQSRRERENELKLLVSDDYAAWREVELELVDGLAAPGGPEPDYAASLARARAGRVELTRSEIGVERAGLEVAYRRDRLKPALGVTGGFGYRAADRELTGLWSDLRGGEYPFYEAGVTLSFPWSRSGERAELRAARAEERQARLRLAQREQAIDAEVDDAVAAVASGRLRVEATAAARAYAEAALAADRERVAAGALTGYDVLLRQRDFVSARADEVTALADYQSARAELRRAEGGTLAHWGIETLFTP